MMRASVWSCLVALCLVAGAEARPPAEHQEKLPFELEEAVTGKYKAKGFNGTWISDTAFAFKNEAGDIQAFDVRKKSYATLVSADEIKVYNVTGFTVSPNQKYILFQRDFIEGFRHSSHFRCFIFNLETKDVVLVSRDMHVQLAQWVPKSSALVYVRDNNVFYRRGPTLNDKEFQLTHDGEAGVKYNGVADWVYEEEMIGTSSALWFSPDGQSMAIACFDDSSVDEIMYFRYGEPGTAEGQYPELIDLRYPKAGRANPLVKLKVVRLADVRGRSVHWVAIPSPVAQIGAEHLLGDVVWATNSQLAVTWLNRRQNLAVMQLCDADSGSCKTELTTSEPNGWIPVQSPWFTPDGNHYVIVRPTKQPSGTTWPHLTEADLGSEPKPITSGNRTVMAVLGVDHARNHIFYTGTSTESSAYKEVFVAGSRSLSLTQSITDEDGRRCRFGSASFSKGYSYAAVSCTGRGTPQVALYDVENDEIVVMWEENLKLRADLAKRTRSTTRELEVDVPNGFKALVKLYLPPGFDENDHTKKYPMLVNVYGGPGSKKINDGYTVGFHEYIITNRKYIYCEIDGRGSALRSNELMFAINNVLGTVEIEDQISVTKKLKEMFAFIDQDRVAVWGWSYGGYATSMILVQDKENVFKCGAAVAPVTSWLYYDTIYTERYMGVPAANPRGYAESDLTLRAEDMRDKRYLLIHGNADDNVHYQNAMQLARRLQLLNIPFDVQSYPNEAHGLKSVLPHVHHTIDRFFVNCFQSQS